MIEPFTQSGFILAGQAEEGTETVALLSLGPAGWQRFAASPEYAGGAAHPLDRWTQRVVGQLAAESGLRAVFPFGGPPYEPFLRWARESGRAWPSPVGMLVHERMGLWISYRAALFLPAPLPEPPKQESPCTGCPAPCLTACPVGALGAGGYDVPACVSHVASPEGETCRAQGCRARAACPAGEAPAPDRARFHMAAFLRTHRPEAP